MHFWRIVIVVIFSLAFAVCVDAEPLPRSVLVLSQWDPGLPWYVEVYSAFNATLRANSPEPVTVYAEPMDLSRFQSPLHQEVFRNYLRQKYQGKNIGVIVVVGPLSLEFMLSARSELWPNVPLVFNSIDESTIARLKLPPDVTGGTIQLTLSSMIATARALVPKLQRFALVGEALGTRSAYGKFKQELPEFTSKLELIDLTGLPMTELKRRVAVLPENTAIIYTAIFVDGAGVAFDPTLALAALAEVANRPIVVVVETQLGTGAVGGTIFKPALVGDDAARRTLRILNGENVANIPIAVGNFTLPVFDWRQLSRWGISESQLPPGSEVRYRRPDLWDQYRGLVIVTIAVLLAQAAMIAGLIFEHRRRRRAEIELRQRVLEVFHLSGTATASALSASVAHELNQPLGAIQTSTDAAELYLKADPPNIEKVGLILANIRRNNNRAADIISHLRGLLKKRSTIELQEFDLNDVVRKTFQFLEPEAVKRGVTFSAKQTDGPLLVRADQIHIEQVILNLAINGMDAMQNLSPGTGEISIETALAGRSTIEVSVTDSGTGIPESELNEVFDTFFTTKPHGTGLGLAIARTIIENYGGRIWAENRPQGGALFRFSLPSANVLEA
jgi:signal transduction histidine kinase